MPVTPPQQIHQVKVVNERPVKRFFLMVLGGFAAGCLTWLMTAGIFIVILMVLFSLSSSSPTKLRETVLERGPEDARIAIIHINGEIVSEADYAGNPNVQSSSTRVVQELKQASADTTIKAIIMKVNSPGGGVVPSREIYEKVLEVKKAKKIYVAMNDIAASGGYYVSAPANRIFALPDTFTGSIGVILEVPNVTGLLGKIGVSFETFKSGKHKDIGSPFRNPDSEERQILQGVVDQAFTDFKQVIKDGRGLADADLNGIEDGRILTGKQALAKKLVDEIGDTDDAVNFAKKEAGLTEAQVFEYATPGFFESISSAKSKILKTISGSTAVLPRLLYIWSPGK